VTPGAAGALTPIGEQSAAILAELGYSETELTTLRESGTIA
jgi:crotonobetainyl-CoA:carnitine CoA-transferase CaiB-like acyl-CoA transferase